MFHPRAPAPPAERIGGAVRLANQIAALLRRASPIPGFACGQIVEPDRDRGPFVPDLPLRPIQHDIELVLAEDQVDIGKFVTSVAAVGLEGAQFTVAVKFCVPARRQDPAQRGQAEPGGQIERPIADKCAAAIGTLRRQRAGQRLDVTNGESRGF